MSEWKPIESAPYQKVIEVKNDKMDFTLKATRGYADERRRVHPDQTFCTGLNGELICPTVWRNIED